jgi:DNA-nicking Smr family endonuclease
MLTRLLRLIRLARRSAHEPAPEAAEERPGEEDTAVDPLDGELDLHTFRPAEVADLVREYVLACQAKGVLSLRIVHGKGRGTLRRTVHAALERMPDVVQHHRLAEPARGGWGATLVDLHPPAAPRTPPT